MAVANINIADFIKEGSNITFTTSDEGRIITIAASGGGGGHTIQDEGTPLTARANLNFVGAGVAVTDDSGNNATVVTISGGGSGTVNSGTQYRIAYYATTGTAVSEASAITASRALISDANGVPTHSTVTATELGYLSGLPADFTDILELSYLRSIYYLVNR